MAAPAANWAVARAHGEAPSTLRETSSHHRSDDRDAGVVLEWDPSTPPALRVRLTVMGLSMMRFGLAGGAIALVCAAFTNKPVLYTAAGIGIAALIGGIHGHLTVQSGWRLRGYLDADGVEHVEIIVKALPEAITP